MKYEGQLYVHGILYLSKQELPELAEEVAGNQTIIELRVRLI